MKKKVVKFVYYDRSYKNLKPEIDFAIQRVLSSGNLILRQDVEEFEDNLARFVGTKYAIALNSGTDAIYLSLKALKIKGRIAISSHTFKSTCGAAINAGLKPIIYDINQDARNTNASSYILVHLAGEISPKLELTAYQRTLSVYADMRFPIIEDACQALGAVKNPTTSAQCWSFYPAKILGAFGDAGAVTTNDEKIAEYIREARNHFKGDNRDFGINSRMDNLQAVILNVKFKYLPKYLERRKQIAEKYLKELKNLLLELPNNQKGRVWQDFIIRTEKRDELYGFLKKEGIETMKNEYPWSPEYPKLPLAAKYESETLRIPCNAEILDEEVDYVIKKIKEFYESM